MVFVISFAFFWSFSVSPKNARHRFADLDNAGPETEIAFRYRTVSSAKALVPLRNFAHFVATFVEGHCRLHFSKGLVVSRKIRALQFSTRTRTINATNLGQLTPRI